MHALRAFSARLSAAAVHSSPCLPLPLLAACVTHAEVRVKRGVIGCRNEHRVHGAGNGMVVQIQQRAAAGSQHQVVWVHGQALQAAGSRQRQQQQGRAWARAREGAAPAHLHRRAAEHARHGCTQLRDTAHVVVIQHLSGPAARVPLQPLRHLWCSRVLIVRCVWRVLQGRTRAFKAYTTCCEPSRFSATAIAMCPRGLDGDLHAAAAAASNAASTLPPPQHSQQKSSADLYNTQQHRVGSCGFCCCRAVHPA